MKYPLINTKWKSNDLILLAIIIILINFLFLGYFGLFFTILDIAITTLFFYRLHEFLFTEYPIEIETKENELVLSYDRGLKRHLKYSYISEAFSAPYNEGPNEKLYIALKNKRALKNIKRRISRLLLADPATARKLIKDIKERANLKKA